MTNSTQGLAPTYVTSVTVYRDNAIMIDRPIREALDYCQNNKDVGLMLGRMRDGYLGREMVTEDDLARWIHEDEEAAMWQTISDNERAAAEMGDAAMSTSSNLDLITAFATAALEPHVLPSPAMSAEVAAGGASVAACGSGAVRCVAGVGARAGRGGMSDGVFYRVETSKGFTDRFDATTIKILEHLGLIRHVRDGYDLEDGHGNGVGPLVRHYAESS